MRATGFVVFLVVAALCTSALGGEAGQKIKVLIVTGGHGFQKGPFLKMFEDNADITFTAAPQGKSSEAYDREDLYDFDVVVLYDLVQKITETQKRRFLALFDKGVGLVALHHCLASYQAWGEFEKILGGKYLLKEEKRGDKTWPASGFRHGVDIPVKIVSAQHPITTGMSDYTIHDEVYWGCRISTAVTKLITTDHSQSAPVRGWCHTYRAARVVYLMGGHDATAYNDANYRRLVARAIQWAASK